MKICKIYLRDFEQFQNVDLDFTHPETGEPLDKICLIGSNGTGKSKLLKLINHHIKDTSFKIFHPEVSSSLLPYNSKIIFEVRHKGTYYFVLHFRERSFLLRLTDEKDTYAKELLIKLFELKEINDFHSEQYFKKFTESTLYDEFLKDFFLHDNQNDLLIFSPTEFNESYEMGHDGFPKTNVNDALSLNKLFPFYNEVSSNKLNEFWRLLIFNLRKRQEDREKYENLTQNLTKTKAELIREFNTQNVDILKEIEIIWNKILNKAGLYFDEKGASNPFQLTDNLKAYIKLKSNDEIIRYGNLSTGIRNYIFRLGHIFSLYFNREIHRGFLLVDEPENGLFPDFLFDLMDTYKNVIIDKRGQNNTQVFFATHNPIVAAQFQPYERIILEWNEDGSVKASSGVAPEGDDPNDLLKKDFGVRELMGSAGLEKWEEYRDLKRKLKQSEKIEDRMNIASEINKLGQLYNFPA